MFMPVNLHRRFGAVFSPIQLAILLSSFAIAPWAAAEESPDYEESTARFQMTYNWQKHPSFKAAYSSPFSIRPEAERMYTFSTTAFVGVRPWQDGEIYFNPEMVQGIPFSNNLIGLGGYTNGEITRAAGSNPSIYRQRLYLRQTWNHGGGSEKVEANLNQMAGTVDKNRFVLTVGNFSTLDVFDNNTYAKDPRTQFMNWGNWTYAAYDYAADARGFGWGFAAEWYQDDWVFRIGRMSGPQSPNTQAVDLRLGKHFGDQIEVERDYTLFGQPGKTRVLGWRNKARLASWKDSLEYLNNHVGTDPQTIFNVRGEKFKYGIGLNIEQAITENTGFFLRAMQADGRTETYAFTDVDASLSTGLLFKGESWGREGDTLGISAMRNALSADHRRFLEAGGASYFLGDGALRYRPESIFEGFYSLKVLKGVWLTADYQRIVNPAYNADRGPIDIYAARFHAEF
jgi:hypothetical protein